VAVGGEGDNEGPGGGNEAGFAEMKSKTESILSIDLKERNASPLDDVVEETIVRHFGLVIAEDDFSPAGTLRYVPPSVDGQPSDYDEYVKMSGELAQVIAAAAVKRDALTEQRKQQASGASE